MHPAPSECRKALRQCSVISPLLIYGEKHIHTHAVASLCTGTMQGSLLVCSKRQEKRLRSELSERCAAIFFHWKMFFVIWWVHLESLGKSFPGNNFTHVCLKADKLLHVGAYLSELHFHPMAGTPLGSLPFSELHAGLLLPLGKQIQSISENINRRT